ncbi:DNA methyltransferase [Mesoterricola silvestris]|uniref:DNA methylase n=1 Tax=Mesoterricola silvestris TaxID=2927979 RepID=A0AA48GMR4_9BACT|nr:DNA methyltransferase [Mesoterricola silvestris]BDU74184.1 DNA methylase [Mesoterricola silvestris]
MGKAGRDFLDGFQEGARSEVACLGSTYPVLTREFWTSRQRQAHALHEVSYRACYKPQLPRLFIEGLTEPGDRVYDPFSGRGTTALEAALLGRRVAANDINPLSRILLEPRLAPPEPGAVEARLREIPLDCPEAPELGMFFHGDTEREIRSLRAWFQERERGGAFDALDGWIRMVATNRLTGHSPGFFSVYTLPPNQAVGPAQQVEINRKRGQVPAYRDTRALILRKTRQLVAGLTPEEHRRLRASDPRLLTGPAAAPGLEAGSVRLTVTSPPFLDVVQYQADNWLRCWFCGLDAAEVGRGITMARTVEAWSRAMAEVFGELHRVTAPGGHVAFEVGEVRKGTVRLEEVVLPLGAAAGFAIEGVLINQQAFTKTANIWGVSNNTHGTNSNRIALFRKA